MHQRSRGRRYESHTRNAIAAVNKPQGQGRLIISSATKKYCIAKSTLHHIIIQASISDALRKTRGSHHAFSDLIRMSDSRNGDEIFGHGRSTNWNSLTRRNIQFHLDFGSRTPATVAIHQ